MRMTSLLFLSVLCSGLTTVAVGQLDDFDRGSPPARNRTNSADVFYGNDSDTPGFTKPRALVPVALVKFVVHTPSGEPAGLAQVELYRGEVVNVHVAGDESSEIKITVPDSFSRSGQQRRQSFPADGDGTFEAPVVGPTKLVIIHESGYDIQTVKPDAEKLDRPKETTGPQIIKLQPWGHVSGRVTLNKKPPTGRRVSARWESFPFSSSMLNLEKLLKRKLQKFLVFMA